jgi:hypothetical protein
MSASVKLPRSGSNDCGCVDQQPLRLACVRTVGEFGAIKIIFGIHDQRQLGLKIRNLPIAWCSPAQRNEREHTSAGDKPPSASRIRAEVNSSAPATVYTDAPDSRFHHSGFA